MTAAPFTPKGDVAEWRLIYDELRKLDHDDVLTYDQAAAVLGRDLRDDRGPLYRAVKELQANDRKTADAVRGVGYRVVHANEHERLARHRRARAHRQVRRGTAVIRATDRARLNDDERGRLERLEIGYSRLDQAFRAMTRRQDDHEQRLRHLETSGAPDVEAKVEDLTRKLRDRGLIDP